MAGRNLPRHRPRLLQHDGDPARARAGVQRRRHARYYARRGGQRKDGEALLAERGPNW